VLVFPKIIKAGLVFGGSYGEGVLMKGTKVEDYYNSVSGSWGLQAGAQSYGYVVFLMNDKALKYITETKGWEIGVGPTVVVVDEGVAKNLSSSTLKDDAYAFIFDQQGLMAGISIEGTKISLIKRQTRPRVMPVYASTPGLRATLCHSSSRRHQLRPTEPVTGRLPSNLSPVLFTKAS
jgi:lipid-binding SYLF domain-containing protein